MFYLRRLKSDAIPRIFPNLPAYMSSVERKRRSTSATSDERLVLQQEHEEEQIESFFDEDKVFSLQEIRERYSVSNCKPKKCLFNRY